MFQVGNKSLIIHLAYLLPIPLGSEKHYSIINTVTVLLLPLLAGTPDALLINHILLHKQSPSWKNLPIHCNPW